MSEPADETSFIISSQYGSIMQSIFTYIGYFCVLRFLEPYLRIAFNIIKNYIKSLTSHQPETWTEKYGCWAVVTGSTDGIGRAYASELAERGMNIVLISRTQERLDRAAAEIRSQYNVQTKTVQADFKNCPDVLKHVENELKDLEIGILVNNVGICSDYPIPFHEMSNDLILDHVRVNVMGTMLMTKMILPQMRLRNKGAIINVSSIVECAPWAYFAPYSATKALIKNFTLALQNENLDKAITIQLVSPSIVKTKIANYSPTCHKLPGFVAPDPVTFVHDAIKRLAYSSHTAGFRYHTLQHILFGISNVYMLTFITGIFSRLMKRQHDSHAEIQCQQEQTNTKNE